MANGPSSPQASLLFSKAFQARMRILREGAGLTQADVAKALRVAVDTYKKWENRPKSLIPHQHVQAFVELVGAGPSGILYLFTGKFLEHTQDRAVQQPVRKKA